MDTAKSPGGSQKSSRRLFQWCSTVFFILALAGLGAMYVSDVLRHLRFTALHQRMAALPLILIGCSYLCLQFSAKRPLRESVKGVFLGFAFIFWGGEQLLPPLPLVTLMDEFVVTIFVVDLTLIIREHFHREHFQQSASKGR